MYIHLEISLIFYVYYYFRDTLGDDVIIQVSSEPAKELSKSRKQIEEKFSSKYE